MASRRPTDSSSRTSSTASTPPTTPAPAASASAPEASSAAKTAAAGKARAPRAKKTASVKLPIEISDDARRAMIAESAYLRAERRGFTGGPEKEREDWLMAEAEVDALLQAAQGSAAQ